MIAFSNKIIVICLIIFLLIISAGPLGYMYLNKSDSMKIADINGLGFTSDGERILVSAQGGLKEYVNSSWRKSLNGENDYRGFSIIKDGFYSSSSIEPASSLKNQFNITKRDYSGLEVKTLALLGEDNLYMMTAGYFSNVIYVINSAPNSIMNDSGLYYSVDEAKNWNKSKGENIDLQATTISVHPMMSEMVAVGNNKGVLLSKDYGNRFESVLNGKPVSSLAFTFDNNLLIGLFNNKAKLSIVSLKTGQIKSMGIPDLDINEFITFISSNPKNNNEIVFSTSENNIFLSRDFGETWESIVHKGKGIKENS